MGTRDDETAASPARARASARRASTGSVMATPSRHLDFRGVSQDANDDDDYEDDDDDDYDDEAETTRARRKRRSLGGARVSFSQVVDEEPARPRRDRAWSDDGVASQPRGTRSRRRKVVHWTKREEQFIIQGVKTHGLGRWRQILDEGEGVFHPQRTNGDIKDKWKNLVRKVALTPEDEEIADTRIWRETVAARTIERMLPSLRRRAAESADWSDSLDGDDDAGPHTASPARSKRRRLSQGSTDALQFYIGTDGTAPHLRAVTITPRECPTISSLKRVLARQLLDESPLPTNLQLVSIHTRRLLGDYESVEECAERDGRELYLLHDA